MKFIKEFKQFAMKGNLLDMAVAFVMGAAFGKVVTTFIDGLIMPLVGLATAGADFKSLKYIIVSEKWDDQGHITQAELAIHYGAFLTALIDFIIIS